MEAQAQATTSWIANGSIMTPLTDDYDHQIEEITQQLQKYQTNQQFLKTLSEQTAEMEELQSHNRQSKAELQTATAKVNEIAKLWQNLQETRLNAETQEAEAVHREQSVYERKVGELQACCSTLEEDKYAALTKVRECIQTAEEATLQKEQALFREKQKTEELEKTKETIKQLIQDAAVRTRKEGENVRKQCSVQILRITEELSALQLECADKQSQIERSLRERKAVEEELEKVHKEGWVEPEFRKIEALHHRCLEAERRREDINITLQSTQSKLKKMEMDYSEELSRCQEEIRQLQNFLTTAREECVSISEESLKLQQENTQLHKDIDDLRKSNLIDQKKAKQQMSQLEQNYCLKEREMDAQIRELEETGKRNSSDLTRLLTTQQKMILRRNEDAEKLIHDFEIKIMSYKSELTRQKHRSHELELQLETDRATIAEYERQLAEYQEKSSHLQIRLTLAEQKATTATYQLNMITFRQRNRHTGDTETI